MDEKTMDEVQDAIVIADHTMTSMVEDARDTSSILALRGKVQKVRDEVMKKDVHYGILPGTQKPTLYQDGGDALALTFKIALTFDNQMEGDGIDEIAVRAKCTATYQGEVLGDSEGYASSNEEKYKWRRVVHSNEYDATDPDRRRLKFKRDGTTIKQVRTEPADIVNTVLKMSQKRAKLGVIKTVLAIGEMFGVDIDDVPPEIRAELTDNQPPPSEPTRKKKKKEKKKSKPVEPAPVSTNPDPDEAAEELEDASPNTGQVTEVRELKRGQNQHGEWVMTLIKVNDFEMVTFDTGLASKAQSAMKFGSTVSFDYEDQGEGKSAKLTALQEIKG